MKRCFLALGLLCLNFSLGNGAPIKGASSKQLEFSGSDIHVEKIPYRGGQRACVIVVGNLAITVHDQEGRLVADNKSQGGQFSPKKIDLPPLAMIGLSETFDGNQRACAIASGNFQTPLGIYVYDKEGNCVAWDDRGNDQSKDDLAVDWIPGEKSPFTVELRNLGVLTNPTNLSVHSGRNWGAAIWYPPRDGTYEINFANTSEQEKRFYVVFK